MSDIFLLAMLTGFSVYSYSSFYDDDKETTLIYAIKTGTPEDVKNIIQADPAVVRRVIEDCRGMRTSDDSFKGQTPLHAAAFGYSLPIVKLLVARGADVNARDESGQTPLLMAVQYNRRGGR